MADPDAPHASSQTQMPSSASGLAEESPRRTRGPAAPQGDTPVESPPPKARRVAKRRGKTDQPTTKNEVMEVLGTLFGLPKGDDGYVIWTKSTGGGYGSAAAEISAAEGPPAPEEVLRRAAEYQRRWPDWEFTVSALAKHWYELGAPPPRIAADRTVSDYKGWQPAYDAPAGEGPLGPVRRQLRPTTTPDGQFDRSAYYEATLASERREIAIRLFEQSRPDWAKTAEPRSLGQADPPYEPKLLRTIAAWVADPKPYLVLYGPPGTGKSWIAITIGHRFAYNGTTALFMRYSELMTLIRAEWNNRDSEQQSPLDQVSQVGLLILDDLGATGDIRDWELPYFDTLFNRRLDSGRPTIITTNLRSQRAGGERATPFVPDAGDLEAHIGQRFVSRFSRGDILGVGGPDRRELSPR